jgi:hypothetical protein
MAIPALSQWRSDAASWTRSNRRDLLIVGAVWLVASAFYFVLSRGNVTPRHQQDEFLYWALAKAFAHGDGFTWRGSGIPLRTFLYPVSISPAFHLADSVKGQLELVHAFNALMMSFTAFPAFLMARLFVERRAAYYVMALAIAVPAMNYVGLIGTETAAYPLCTAAFGGILLSATQPRTRNTWLALGLIGFACVARMQFVLLLPIYVATLVLVGLMRGRGGALEYLRQQWVAFLLLFAAIVGGLMAVFVARGTTVGIYGDIFNTAPLTWENVSFWSKSFAADVFLVAAVIPAIATFALLAARSNRTDSKLGPLAALALIAAIAFVAQVAWFSATSPEYWRVLNLFYERYIFYLGPIFFTGLMAARGRVSPRAAIVTSVIAVVVVSGFQTDALATPFSYEAFGLTYLSYLASNHVGGEPPVGLWAAGVTAVLGLIYVASTVSERHAAIKRYGTALAISLPLILLVVTQARAWSYAWLYAEDSLALEPSPVDFIDRSARNDVGMIVAKGTERIEYFQDEFWNPRITQMYASESPPVSSPKLFTPNCPFEWTRKGQIVSELCPRDPGAWYLRSDQLTMHLRGETSRKNPKSKTTTLIAAPSPTRIESFLDGRNPDTGVVTGNVSVTSFLDQPGELRVTLLVGGALKSLKYSLPRDEHVTRIAIPGSGVKMKSAELREGNGPWRPIT